VVPGTAAAQIGLQTDAIVTGVGELESDASRDATDRKN
jgi:hypothetical protein